MGAQSGYLASPETVANAAAGHKYDDIHTSSVSCTYKVCTVCVNDIMEEGMVNISCLELLRHA